MSDMKPATRYQAAIIRDGHVLLIKHHERATKRTYWVLPGGRRDPGETEEACVRREIREETGLDISVDRLLSDESIAAGFHRRYRTYLCEVLSGDPRPGSEPEADAAWYEIVEVRWFDLRRSYEWEDGLKDNPIIFPLLQRIRELLGYAGASPRTDH